MLRPITTRRLLLAALALGFGLFGSACAHDPRSGFESDELAVKEIAPMGGEALLQRKVELQRALQDMTAFRKTLESMNDRGDDRGVGVFREFMNNYMATHLEQLLSPQWQSTHPELILVDANLRFVQAEVLLQMGYSGWTDDVLDELSDRYKGRDNMLVDYPVGRQSTLHEALRIIRDREWRS